jgi:hypothetical protein
VSADPYGYDDPVWGDLFRKADEEWAALLAESEKGREPLKEGFVWQQRKVKRGARWVNEMVQVPNPLQQIEKEKEMRKATPKGANPKGRGVELGQVDKYGDQVKQRQQQRFVDILLEPLNRVVKELEQKWGYDRLPGLVDIETAEKFASAAQKLQEAIASADTERIKSRAEVMRRGWLRLDELAEAGGHEPWKALEVWEGRRPDGLTFLVTKDKAAAIQANRETGTGVWTLDEIGHLLQHFDKDGLTQKLKEEFGASIVSVGGAECPF